MLNKHLIAATRPKAAAENVVLWKDYRVTVLQDGLFRLEKSAEKKFRDEATQCVWFRDMPAQSFQTKETPDALRITTARCTLVLAPSRKNCCVEINGKTVKIDNRGNLQGTYRTLDMCDGGYHVDDNGNRLKKVDLGNGVCSKSGVAAFDDAQSLTLAADGIVRAEYGNGTDEYVFAYGSDYREAVKALYLITGEVPMVPRFALGNWWSRYHVYTDKEYLTVLNRFEEQEIPLTVATIDMDWHYSDGEEIDRLFGITSSGKKGDEYGTGHECAWGYGWTGYSWHKDLFPDYKGFLKQIEEKNLKITLNLHPADGIRFWDDCYTEVARAMGVDPETKRAVKFDIADPNFVNVYFDLVHRPLEKDGVDFWWIDWQQGTQSKLEGLDPLWSLNHYHYLDQCESHSAPLILSRYAGIGSHRYPLGFSGDTAVSWDTLKYLPYFTLTASNAGYTWWSHDIGGHHMGYMETELYARHVQYGVFSPVNRLHCTSAPYATKEPRFYGNGAGKIAADWLRFRHRLIPYLYTADRRTHEEGIALVEPLYYEHPEAPEAYEYKEEYFFGGELLVAPVTQKAKADGYARIKVWLPEGKWTDLFTGDCYEIPAGGARKTLLRDLDSIPVLAKAGAVIPLSRGKGNDADNPAELELQCFTGNGNYTLFEDGAMKNKKGEFFTEFRMKKSDGVQKLTIASHGEKSVLPARRKLFVRFPEIEQGEITLTVDGAEMPVKDPLIGCASVEIPFEADKEYEITVRYREQTEIEKFKAHALNVLTRAEETTVDKREAWYRAICTATTAEEFATAVEKAELKPVTKLRLTEIM